MTKKLILAAFVAAMAFTSCHKDPTPTPTPEPQTVTRLAKEYNIRSNMLNISKSSATYTWENGNLMHVCDTVSLGSYTNVTQERMVYEGGRIVRIEEENGKWEHHFTYENDLIVNFLTLRNGDSSVWGTVSYNADKQVKEIMYHTRIKSTKWSLTWVDGDATQVVEQILEPEDVAGTNVYNYTYDDKLCAYNGFPMAYSIFDGDGIRIATRQSKHNRIREGYTYDYDNNGLLTSLVSENNSMLYHYIEQTVE